MSKLSGILKIDEACRRGQYVYVMLAGAGEAQQIWGAQAQLDGRAPAKGNVWVWSNLKTGWFEVPMPAITVTRHKSAAAKQPSNNHHPAPEQLPLLQLAQAPPPARKKAVKPTVKKGKKNGNKAHRHADTRARGTKTTSRATGSGNRSTGSGSTKGSSGGRSRSGRKHGRTSSNRRR